MPKRGLLWVLVLSLIFVIVQFGHVFFAPNSHMFGSTGDAIKNYYTFSYYITNNTSLSNFEGMNFPYGENVFYTDGHPLLSWMLKGFSTVFPEIAEHSIGILNFLMLLSIPLCAWCLYLLFRRWKMNELLSVSGAVVITMLAPQLTRMVGHFALAYVCAIPFTILFTFRFFDRPTFIRGFVLFVNLILWLFTHAYLGAICSLFVLAITFGSWCIRSYRKSPGHRRIYFVTSGISVTVLLLFFLSVKMLDTHEWRNTEPMGIWNSTASPRSVFLPYQGPLADQLREWGVMDKSGEGASYIGIFTSVFILLSTVFLFIRKILYRDKMEPLVYDSSKREVLLIFFSSIPLLLLAMLIPFRFGMEGLLDELSFIKQFRAIGRFAWPFYFASGILLIYLIGVVYKYLQSAWIKRLYVSLVCIGLVYQSGEAFSLHVYIIEQSCENKNLFREDALNEEMKELLISIRNKDEKWQAILPLPFFHMGSEHFTKVTTGKVYLLNQLLSYHLKLPIVGAYLTRTSMQEAKNVFQVFTESIYDRPWYDDLPNDKPFLILCRNSEKLNSREKAVLERAELVSSVDEFSAYSISCEELKGMELKEEILEEYALNKDKYVPYNNFMVEDTLELILHESFDGSGFNSGSQHVDGIFRGSLKETAVLIDSNLPNCLIDSIYTCSFWVNNNGYNYGQGILKSFAFIQEVEGDSVIAESPIVQLAESLCIDGDWSLIEVDFTRKRANSKLRLIVKGHKSYDKPLFIDDVLIIRKGSKVYREKEVNGRLMMWVNNHRIFL